MTVTMTLQATGSILADTVSHRIAGISTTLRIDSPAEPEAIQKALATSERMCFVVEALRQPLALEQVLVLNGQPLGPLPLGGGAV